MSYNVFNIKQQKEIDMDPFYGIIAIGILSALLVRVRNRRLRRELGLQ